MLQNFTMLLLLFYKFSMFFYLVTMYGCKFNKENHLKLVILYIQMYKFWIFLSFKTYPLPPFSPTFDIGYMFYFFPLCFYSTCLLFQVFKFDCYQLRVIVFSNFFKKESCLRMYRNIPLPNMITVNYTWLIQLLNSRMWLRVAILNNTEIAYLLSIWNVANQIATWRRYQVSACYIQHMILVIFLLIRGVGRS